MTKTRSFSDAQLAYMEARAFFDASYQAGRDYDKLMDLECDKLGIETPYGILPDGHPMRDHAQLLLDRENVARKLMYSAAHNLFDWAIESTLAKKGTSAQKVAIRAMVAKVKKMAHVERFFIELVDTSMKLDIYA